MEKIVLFIGLFCLFLITILSGCAENEGDNIIIPPKNYTWTAKQVT